MIKQTRRAIIILCVILTGLFNSAWAQHHAETPGAEGTHHGKHKLSFYAGFTHISSAFYEHETHEESTGKWVPTIGVDYYYTLSKRWDIGFIGDVELDSYYIKTEEHAELERANVVVLSMVGKYKPIKRIGIIAGPGFETEFKKDHTATFVVLKTGLEYEVAIENGWELTPMFSYDFKEEYSTYSFGITIGKRF